MTTPDTPQPEQQPDPEPYVWAAERKPRKAAFVTAGIAVAVVAALGGAIAVASGGSADSDTSKASTSAPDKLGLDGVLQLADVSTARSSCIGQGGYADIRPGTQVSVLDESSKILALTELELDEPATDEANAKFKDLSFNMKMYCVYTFGLDELPQATFYKFAIGGGNMGNGRGGLTYSREEMVSKGGHVEMSLGS